MKRSVTKVVFIFLAAITLWRFVGAALLPVSQDEAYYFLWAQRLSLGYFDHPPLVALMLWTANLVPGSWLWGRVGTVLASALICLVSARLFYRTGLRSPMALLLALVLSNFNLMGLIYGFLATPDVVLLLGWTLALNEAAAAIQGNPRRWITAGAATGFGLLGKYAMALIGPVFLWAMLRSDKSVLRTPWPYAGGVVALLVFLPHLIWNAENDWITFRFQLRHRFALEGSVVPAAALPAPLPELEGSPESRLGARFDALEEAEAQEEKKPASHDPLLKSLNRYIGYFGSQLALWGLLLVPLGATTTSRLKRRWRHGREGPYPSTSPPAPSSKVPMDEDLKPLLQAGTWVPLLVFGALSLFMKVEANWSAMYVLCASALLVPTLFKRKKLVAIGAALNATLVFTALVHANSGILPTRPHRDRILLETHGYKNLAKHVNELDGYIFADSYQITSMLNFYAPAAKVMQWPGITRDSELVRRPFRDVAFRTLLEKGFFWLVTTNRTPPRIRGFVATSLTQLRDCKGSSLQSIPAEEAVANVDIRCKKPVHEWYLVRYESY